jgi:hypothetical protein
MSTQFDVDVRPCPPSSEFSDLSVVEQSILDVICQSLFHHSIAAKNLLLFFSFYDLDGFSNRSVSQSSLLFEDAQPARLVPSKDVSVFQSRLALGASTFCSRTRRRLFRSSWRRLYTPAFPREFPSHCGGRSSLGLCGGAASALEVRGRLSRVVRPTGSRLRELHGPNEHHIDGWLEQVIQHSRQLSSVDGRA